VEIQDIVGAQHNTAYLFDIAGGRQSVDQLDFKESMPMLLRDTRPPWCIFYRCDAAAAMISKEKAAHRGAP
jgi:hypothetical protein